MKTPRDVEGDLATEELVDPAEATGSADAIIAPKDVVGRSPWEIFWRQFRKDRWALAGIVIVVIMILLAILAPLFARIVHHGPNDVNLRALDDFGLPSGPSKEYWFGVDGTGRDLFIRVLYGARTSLVIAFFATGLALVIGVILGLAAGFYRGKIDTVISRTTDVVLSLPILLLALGLASACGASAEGCLGGLIQPGLMLVSLIIGLFSWPYIARIIRGQVLSLREREFVQAAQVMGVPTRKILFKELLPNLVAPIVVATSLALPGLITAEAGLSFLGIGINGYPSLGQTIADAQQWWDQYPLYLWAPVLTISILVVSLNLLGDSIRDAFDPKTRR